MQVADEYTQASPDASTLSGTPPTETQSPTKDAHKVQDTQFAEVCGRLRNLLSRQNVSVDPSLALIMSDSVWASPQNSSASQIAVPVDGLMSHPMISSLGCDKETVLRAAETLGPHLLVVDRENGLLCPVMRAERSTIMLRDMKATEEEVRALVLQAECLKDETSPPILNVRHEPIANTWFVTLTTSKLATETAFWLRSQQFKESPIKVGVKSESEFQSFVSRPLHHFNAEGAFVPNAVIRGLNAFGDRRRNDARGGRAYQRGQQRRRPNNGDADDDKLPLTNRSHQPRGGRGFRSRMQPSRPDTRADGNAVAVAAKGVDIADFPPLVESSVKLGSIGYEGRPFLQYSPSVLRAIQRETMQRGAEEEAPREI